MSITFGPPDGIPPRPADPFPAERYYDPAAEARARRELIRGGAQALRQKLSDWDLVYELEGFAHRATDVEIETFLNAWTPAKK